MGAGATESPLPADALHAGHVVVDLVYHPADTALLKAARAAGAITIGGLGMLVHQAAHAFTRWTGVDAPVEAMRAAARAHLGEARNGRLFVGRAGSRSRSMLRFLTAGESHGQAFVVIVEGLPAGLDVTVEDVQGELARRRLGFGRGPRMRFEEDDVTLLGGVRHGRTLGSPVAIEIKNSEWFRSDKWHEEMSPAPGATAAPLTQPRLRSCRPSAGAGSTASTTHACARASARLHESPPVAHKTLLATIGTDVLSHVIQMGEARSKATDRPSPAELAAVEESPVRCFDPAPRGRDR